jgi:hypothetical protein
MSDTRLRAQQIQDLRSLSDTLTRDSHKNERETWQDIRKGIAGNEGFRNMWNNPEKLGDWIKSKTTPQQQPKSRPASEK